MNRKVLFSLDEVKSALMNFNVSEFSMDTETLPTTNHPKSALRYSEQKISGISICDGKSTYYIPLIDDEQRDVNGQEIPRRTKTLQYLSENLFATSSEGRGKKIICQNIPFDAAVLHKYNICFDKAKWFDTKVASHLLDENSPNGLKYMVENILGKEVAHFNPNLSHYCEEFYEYALDDAQNTWDLYQHFLPLLLEDEQLANLFFRIEMPFQRVLVEMRVNGVDVDMNNLQIQRELLEKDKFELEKQLHDALNIKYEIVRNLYGQNLEVSSELNLNSSQQLAKILFQDLGLEVVETTPTGQPKTGKITLDKYKEHPFVKLLRQYKGCEKLLNAFVVPLPEHIEVDGKVRPSFHDTGTKTGRLSCSEPNLQQLADPKKAEYKKVNFRENFIAPEGYKMFSADYSGQEICVMAQESKDPTLVKSLRNGYDMHLAIANQFYDLGIPEECLNTTHEDYETYKEKYKVERSKAKTITFGLAYGKAQPLDCKILTPNGWKYMYEMHIGSKIFTADGSITEVVGVFPQKTAQDIYEVEMFNGDKTRCTGDHLWKVKTRYDIQKGHSRIMKTTQMLSALKKGTQNNIFIEYNKELQFPEKELPLDPYLMGIYLGDGDSCNRLTIAKTPILVKVLDSLPEGYTLSPQREFHYTVMPKVGKIKNNKGQYISGNLMKSEMRRVGLEGRTCVDKFIPKDYLHSGIEQRKALLQGLIDSDGAKNNNGFEYTTVSKSLARDVSFLAKSLGARVRITSRIPKTNFASARLSYRVFISFPPFQMRNSIRSIKKIGKDISQCIKVKHPSQLYITDDFIVTHNTSYGFSKDFGVSEDEAQEIVDNYFRGMPELKKAIEDTHTEVKKRGFVRNLAGRYRRFSANEQGYYPNSALRQAFNFKIQGFSADMIRASAVNIWSRKRQHPEWDLKFIMTVHDELVFIVRTEFVPIATKFVQNVMEQTAKLVVPMKCDVEIGNNYGDAK